MFKRRVLYYQNESPLFKQAIKKIPLDDLINNRRSSGFSNGLGYTITGIEQADKYGANALLIVEGNEIVGASGIYENCDQTDENGMYKCVAATWIGATKERNGIGSIILSSVAKIALKTDLPIVINATLESLSFYKKLLGKSCLKSYMHFVVSQERIRSLAKLSDLPVEREKSTGNLQLAINKKELELEI
jgi:hypothetical protein